MPDIELIITDLDGTFTLNEYEFCPENAEAVRAAQRRGIRVCACTARNWGMAKGQARRAGFDPYTIACNGASIVSNATGLPVERSCLAPDEIKRLLDIAAKHGAVVAAYTNEQVLYLCSHAAEEYLNYARGWATAQRDLAIPVTGCDSLLEMAVLAGDICELVEFIRPDGFSPDEDETAFLNRFSIADVQTNIWHIMPYGISKLSGAKRLAGLLGAPRERVMAVGNNRNDAEMLRWAGYGVSVGDGDEYAKAAADHITLAHDRAGFYHAVMDVLRDL